MVRRATSYSGREGQRADNEGAAQARKRSRDNVLALYRHLLGHPGRLGAVGSSGGHEHLDVDIFSQTGQLLLCAVLQIRAALARVGDGLYQGGELVSGGNPKETNLPLGGAGNDGGRVRTATCGKLLAGYGATSASSRAVSGGYFSWRTR